ncbi:MAG: Cof-type HAD-IIB family hydrolase [Erysipelotrichaceae bacterium]
MTYKVLFVDVDGTILEYGKHEIHHQVQEALIALQQAGYILVLSSGRILQGMLKFREVLHMDRYPGFIICNNGGVIYDSQTLHVLSEKIVPTDVVQEAYAFAMEHGLHVMLNMEERVIMSGYDEAVGIEHDSIDVDFLWPNDMTPYLSEKILRVNLTHSQVVLDAVEPWLHARIGEKASIMRSQHIFMDVMAKDCDKVFGIRFLSEYLHIDPSEMVAVGDGGNDLEMIVTAGLGVAMGNAIHRVREVANVVAPSVYDQGVAWVIRQYFKLERS